MPPVDDPVSHGVLEVPEPLLDPDGEVELDDDVELPAGGGTLWSPEPVWPAGRPKYWPVAGS